jgi:hypothetical protein
LIGFIGADSFLETIAQLETISKLSGINLLRGGRSIEKEGNENS